ncbi:hypothetical protein EGH21_12160 [Halomicroarcula sp. F13]|uniref:Uncharacterized protein n=1 Tax=Haloarcula rubra TaxID=2487747 RepID=A0AAW4PQA5_9EURY|nr:hypothetical protein [Halomicroarcula rubra]MBX0323783.1 hypothetical protein [Halomicroarcula rubra]
MLSLSLGEWVVVCVLSGLFAAVLMNIPMYVQPEGYLPAYVAAGGLTGVDPADAQTALAVAVHHVTGTAAALLYGAIVVVFAAILPTAVSLVGVPALPHLLGAVGVTLFIYYFFERVAMPRAGGSLGGRRDDIVQQWALSSFIYGTTLALVVPVFVTQL